MTDLAGYFVTRQDGSSLIDPESNHIASVLAQMDTPVDGGHPSVSLTHASGWTLEAFPSGLLILQNARIGAAPRHLRGATRELVAGLWASLALGDLETIEVQDWRAGRGQL